MGMSWRQRFTASSLPPLLLPTFCPFSLEHWGSGGRDVPLTAEHSLVKK